MTKPKKKPKTGDVVGWAVLNRHGYVYDEPETRKEARESKRSAEKLGHLGPYTIAKIVLA